MMENFTPIRNGILQHLRDGRISPFDLGVYVFLHLRADWQNGIYSGCALSIAHGFNDPALKEHINKSLLRLRSRRYINYRKGDGRRGAYPILIHKYHVTVGELSGTRLDAWKHGALCTPDYTSWNSHGRVVEESRKSDGRVVAPTLDLLDCNQDLQDVEPKPSALSGGVQKKATRIPENFSVTPAHRQFASENGLPSPESEIERFKDHFRAAVGQRGVKKDWDATFRNWLRRAAEISRQYGGTNGKTRLSEIAEREINILRSRIPQ